MLEKQMSIKKVVNISAFFVAVAGMWSCSADESLTQTQTTDAITFTTRMTRASDTKWDNGDKIGVYMLPAAGGDALAVNKSYSTADGLTFSTSATGDALNYPKDGAAVKFFAYYPFTASVTDGVYKVNVADQGNPAGIDLMYAPAGQSYTSGSPLLTFSHKLAQVSVTLTSTDGKDLSGIKVALQQVPTTADYKLTDGTFGTLSTLADVAMHYKEGTTTATFTAFLIPGTYTDGLKMVVSDGATVSKPAALTQGGKAVTSLVSGENYTFTSKVSGIGKDASSTPSEKGNYWMETPTLTAADLSNSNLIYKTYWFKKNDNSKEERNFSILFDKTKKMALWVAYPLNTSYTGDLDRDGIPWIFDDEIDHKYQINVTKNSYPGAGAQSGFNRGHQIPNSDRNGYAMAQKQTFYVTNQTPQNNAMNGGVWQSLEKAVRGYAAGTDTLFVVTGPLFEKNIGTDNDNDGVSITRPSGYFKAVAKVTRDASGKVTKAQTVGYIIPNEQGVKGNPYTQYSLSVKEIEARTKFKLFPSIPDNYKNSTTW